MCNLGPAEDGISPVHVSEAIQCRMMEQRLKRAIKGAIRCLDNPKGSYQIILLNNGPFHIEAIREKEIRKIRIAIDYITSADVKTVQAIKLPHVCTKEIWCKKNNEREFKKIEIL